MDDKQQRLMEIFNEARTKASAEERDAYLASACADDAGLRRHVEILLQAHTRLGDFLKPPADDPPDEYLNTVIDRYQLREQIGEGGFGVVYLAEQTGPVRRKVALKIIKAGMDTKEVIARFEAERQALALMDHPNIARVLDAGTTATGRPYFVMELVKGIPITEYCDQGNLLMAERLQLFMQVCHAVQHAHQKGIIHRDLKPGNILITMVDGKPMPKIIDFGVAKALGQQLTEKTLFTAFQQIVGTPLYMSPEQATINGVDVDTRSDIYSLGVLLYELLTGFTPIDMETVRKAGLDEVRRLIREADPPRPSTRLQALVAADVKRLKSTEQPPAALNLEPPGRASSPRLLQTRETIRKVRGDLDWIVMKALEKDRARRYETANGLRADIQRYLEHEPVLAGPPGMAYRAKKYVRRHRVGVALATSVSLALIAGLVAALIGFAEARRERDRAVAAEEQAEQSHQQAEAERNHAELLAAQATLHKGQEKLEADDSWGLLDMVNAFDLAKHNPDFQKVVGRRWSTWHAYWDRRTIAVRPMLGSPSPDHLQFVSVLDWPPFNTSSNVRLYDTLSGEVVTGPMRHESAAVGCAFSPDGRLLATVTDKGMIHLWDCRTGKPIRPPYETGVAELNQLSFSSDGHYLVAFTGRDMGPRSAKLALINLEESDQPAHLLEHRYPVGRAQFSPDGELLAVLCLPDLQMWRTSDLTQVGPPLKAKATVCEFSADGTRLAFIPGGKSGIALANPRTMQVVHFLHKSASSVTTAGFSHDGHLLASFDWDCNLELWKTESEDGPYAAQRIGVRMYGQFAFNQDDSLLACGDVAGTVRILRTSDGEIVHTLHTPHFPKPVFLSNGVLAAPTERVHFWDLTASPLPGLALPDDFLAHVLEFDRSGKFLAVGSEGELRLWTMQPSSKLERIIPMPGCVIALTWLKAEKQFMVFSDDGSLTKVEPRLGRTTIVRKVDCEPGWTASLSPDGRVLVLFNQHEALVFDTRTGEHKRVGYDEGSLSFAFRPDSRRLAQGTANWKVRLYDDPNAPTNTHVGMLKEFEGWVESIAYHPDGNLLAVCVMGNTLHLYDSGQDRNIGSVKITLVQANLACFSADGSLLAVAGPLRDGGHAVELWHVDAQRGLFTSGVCLRRDQPIWSVAFSPDNQTLIVGGQGSTRLWHLPPQPKNLEQMQSQTWKTLGFRMDEQGNQVYLDPPTNGVEEIRARLTQTPESSDTPLEAALKLPPSEALTAVQRLADQHPALRIYRTILARLHADLVSPAAEQGRWSEAEFHARKSLTIRRKLGNEDRSLDNSLASLARVLGDQGKWAEAEEVRREDLALEKKLSGDEHPFVAYTLSELAVVLAEEGKVAEAEAAARESLAICRRALGDKHPSAAKSLLFIASALASQEKLINVRTNLLATLELSPNDGSALCYCALLHLSSRDTNAYRVMAKRITAQLQTNAPGQYAHLLRWACALAPDAVPDYSPVLQSTRQALAGETNTTNSYSDQQTLGALLYRAHHYDEAVDELTKTLEPGERLDAKTLRTSPAYGAYFLTMAHARLGHVAKARECFQRASALDPLTTPVDTNTVSRISWNRRLTLELLRKEAQSLLKPETPDSGTD